MSNEIKDKLQFFPLFLCVKFDRPKDNDFSSFSSVQAVGNDETNELSSYKNTTQDNEKQAFRRAVRYNLLNIKNDDEDTNINEDLNCKWYLVSAKTLEHAKEKIKNCIYKSIFKVVNNDKEYIYSKKEYHIYFQTLEKNSIITLQSIQHIGNPDENDINSGTVYFINDTPSNANINIYQSAIFEISATGSGCNVYYQWQISADEQTWQNLNDGQYYSGVNTNKLIVSPNDNSEFNEKYFRCKIFNDIGDKIEYSKSAQLFFSAIVINSQPESPIIVAEGENKVLEITAIGNNLTYQWQYKTPENENFQEITSSMNNYSGITSNKLIINNISFNFNNYIFKCIITDINNFSIESNPISLNVNPIDIITFITQPSNTSINTNSSATFTAKAQSTYYQDTSINYQWYYYTRNNNGPYRVGTESSIYTIVENEEGSNLEITPYTIDYNGYSYKCYATNNKGGQTYSNLATLTITAIGEITIEDQPDPNQTIIAGDTISFTITAINVGSYQWQISLNGGNTWEELYNTNYNGNSVTISGVKTKTLEITTTGQAYSWNGTQYKCILSNDDNHIEESNPITLTIEEYNK